MSRVTAILVFQILYERSITNLLHMSEFYFAFSKSLEFPILPYYFHTPILQCLNPFPKISTKNTKQILDLKCEQPI